VTTWRPDLDDAVPPLRIGPVGVVLVLVRGVALAAVNFGCLVILLVVRQIERPLCGLDRPVTPYITQFVCRSSLAIMGIRYRIAGTPMRERGAIVSNHASWLDIFSLNACQRIYFVAKTEVARWPGIGWLARATGTVFIAREPRQAHAQQVLFEARLRAGHRLLFFPEGTSTDGRRVVPFKSTLFSAFYGDGLADILHVQPVTVNYRAPAGADDRFYGWWGDMDFGRHLLRVLARPGQGSVEVVFHRPVRVADFPTRKALAQACETAVRGGLDVGGEKAPTA
jgi:1-acyl-sn-glycerol-3-phosphate acyltransferase